MDYKSRNYHYLFIYFFILFCFYFCFLIHQSTTANCWHIDLKKYMFPLSLSSFIFAGAGIDFENEILIQATYVTHLHPNQLG